MVCHRGRVRPFGGRVLLIAVADRPCVIRRSLAHLTRLCRPVGGPDARSIAPAVYSRLGSDGRLVLVPASESGFEGVACVDDAARMLVLLLAMVRDRHPASLMGVTPHRLTEGLLRFVQMMQLPSGRFVNFVLDWEGTRNVSGPTSGTGGLWWTGRALRSLAWASGLLRTATAEAAFRRGLATVEFTRRWDEESGVIWAVLDFEELHQRAAGLHVRSWVDQLVASAAGSPLPDRPGASSSHLWGRSLELVVARAGAAYGERRWLSSARESCHLWLRPLAASGFASRATTLPYEVASTERNLRVVARLTGDKELEQAAGLCIEWFWGRNPAGVPMVDHETGRTSDGLDGVRPNRNSGAEANIEALSVLVGAGRL